MASRLRYNSIALHFVSRIFIIRSLVKWCFNLINNNHCYMEFIESCVCLCMTSLWILLNNIDCVTRSDRMIGGVMPWTHPTHIKVSFRLAAAQTYTCFSSSLINLSVTYCSVLEEKRKKHWFMSENCSSVCMKFAQVCDVKWSAGMASFRCYHIHDTFSNGLMQFFPVSKPASILPQPFVFVVHFGELKKKLWRH